MDCRQRVRIALQVDRMVRQEGLMDPPIRYIPTVVSPVPEEEEDEEDEDCDGGTKKKDDFSVQEVVENEPTLLRPPPCSARSAHMHRNLLSPCSSTAGVLSPRRSLSPADHVPRPAFVDAARRGQEYPLRRPSSHYDESAQAASSRPVSPVSPRPMSPLAREAVQ